jgi:hypothetical protein
MSTGTAISGAGHAAVILWVVLGDWLFAPDPAPEIAVAQVSLVSAAQFDAMVAAAPAKPDPAPEPPQPPAPDVVAPAPVEPELPLPEPELQPAALPEPPPELVPEVPVSPDPQPVPAPEPVAPIAADEQPIPVPTADKRPRPRPIDRVAATPVDETTDAPEVADTVTPEVSDQANTPEIVQDPAPAAAPEAATTQIVSEAVETEPDAPQLAPTSSRRPQSRPEKVVVTPPEVSVPAETAPETKDAEAEAIAAALAEATAETPAEDNGASDAPTGPPMTSGDIDAMRVAVKQCWVLGAVSSDAARTTVTVQVSLAENGVPNAGSIRMIGSEGGSDAAANIMYEVARRAIIRCGAKGFPLPPEKYDQWKELELVFDPNGMRLR